MILKKNAILHLKLIKSLQGVSMFKVGDRVVSIKDNEATDQIGTVIEVTDSEVIVQPDEFPFIDFSYALNGNHLEDTNFSIRKLEQEH